MEPSISKNDSNGIYAYADLNYSLSGSNKAAPLGLAPDIDLNGSLRVSVIEFANSGSLAFFTGEINGDKFPAMETFITDSLGVGVFLGVSGADGTPVSSLPGDNHRGMATFSIGVRFNNDGNISGVLYDGKSYSVENWNKQFINLNPQDGNVTTNFD